MMNIIIRGIDESLYRRLKAAAALRGLTVGKSVNEAVRLWLRTIEATVGTEHDANNEAYVKMRDELMREHRGKYAVFCRGEFVGVAGTLEEAGRLARASGSRRALITRLGEVEPAGGEWLWSSLGL